MARPFVFVIMPFKEELSDAYELGIRAACEGADADCERVDEQIFTKSILDKIYEQIERADIVVADVTGLNANVLYELGYAHGLGKTVVLLTQAVDQIPFDLRHYPHIVYSKITQLKAALQARISYFLAHPEEAASSAVRQKERRARFEKMAKHIENYLDANGFRSVTFDRVRANINETYTDELLRRMIDEMPDRLRRVRMKGSKPGVGRLVPQ